MLEKNWLLNVAGCVIALVLSAYVYFQLNQGDPYATDIAYTDGDTLVLRAKISADVKTIAVEKGDTVSINQPLVILNTEPLYLAYKANRINYQRTQDDIRQQQQGITQSQALLTILKDALGNREQRISILNDNVKKLEEAVSLGISDPITLNVALSDKQTAIDDVFRLRIDVAKLKKRIIEEEQLLSQLSTDLDRLDNELKTIQLEIDNAHISSPVNGRVAEKRVLEGEHALVGDALLHILPDERFYITAFYDEKVLGDIALGACVKVVLDADKHNPLTAKIVSVGVMGGASGTTVSANYATGYVARLAQRVPVKIRFTSPIKQYLPLGLSSHITRGDDC